MTIPAGNNWCPTCEEACHDHPSVCTVCGTSLVVAPPPPPPAPSAISRNSSSSAGGGGVAQQQANALLRSLSNNNNNNGNEDDAGTATAAVAQQDVMQVLEQHAADANRMRAMLASIREEIQATGAAQQELLANLQNTRAEWQAIPAGLLDPQQAASSSSSHPTSKQVLKDLPRLTLTAESSMLYQSVVTLEMTKNSNSNSTSTSTTNMEFQATLAEFTTGAQSLRDCRLVVAQPPRTGKGGVLDDETIRQVQQQSSTPTTESLSSSSSSQRSTILFLERGDGVTFVQKAKLAAATGASACIIGNHTSEPWPYFMKDSKKEAANNPIIPTVMLKLADAQKLVEAASCNESGDSSSEDAADDVSCSCHLEITKAVQDCVVCTDALAESQTIVRLPACGHVFHESCALQWLESHNTCPYCRRELPTDNEEYEEERRRRQTQQQNSSATAAGGGHYQDFYG